jgi:hypothetical protein
MTQVQRLTWRERAALALVRVGETRPEKHIPRELIMTVRRMAHAGMSVAVINADLDLGMSDACLTKRMKELQINRNQRGHGSQLRKPQRTPKPKLWRQPAHHADRRKT